MNQSDDDKLEQWRLSLEPEIRERFKTFEEVVYRLKQGNDHDQFLASMVLRERYQSHPEYFQSLNDVLAKGEHSSHGRALAAFQAYSFAPESRLELVPYIARLVVDDSLLVDFREGLYQLMIIVLGREDLLQKCASADFDFARDADFDFVRNHLL